MSTLRPTFMGFDVAKRGIMTAQKGIDITGQNLVNWDSAGYTRQRVEQVAVGVNPYTSRYGSNRIGTAGQGVDILGIGQTRDKFLDARFRELTSEASYYDQAQKILGDLESVISDFEPDSDSGIGAMLNGILNALQPDTEQADSETYASLVRSAFKDMTQTLQYLSGKLDRVAEQQKFDLEVSVENFNQILEKISGLNEVISNDRNVLQNSHYGPNELLDERNYLLDQLAQYGEIGVTTNVDGTVTIEMDGHTILDGSKYDAMEMSENPNGTVVLKWVSSGDKIQVTDGILKATTDFLNGRGPNIIQEGETTYRGVRYYQDALDIFAHQLVEVANNSIPNYQVDAAGELILDADGNPVLDPEQPYRKLLGSISDQPDANGKYVVDPDGPVTADNISITDEWNADASYFVARKDSLDNKYVVDLYNKLKNDDNVFQGRGESFTGTFKDYLTGYSATLAQDQNYYKNRLQSSNNLLYTTEDSRDEVSGVVMDEEVANMMLYQKSLQAASRLMTTLDEALDVLINRTGLVGR